jgi:antitoxin (DNA-binding transcriptional repressor) of toxin-antitoxin stability system
MKTVNMHEAKTSLSGLVRDVRSGAEREIVIAIDGNPVARLVPYGSPPPRPLGMDHGMVVIAEDFDAPNGDIAAAFEGH